jgi:predicted permease
MNALVRFLRRRSANRDLQREVEFHLDAHIADLMRAGLTRDEAARQARLALGGPEQVKEDTRDAWGARWLDDAARDARFALRGMARAPGFAAAVVLTLAVGIGATTAVWSITDALMRRSLPIQQPDELHAVLRTGINDDNYRMSYPRFRRLQQAVAGLAPMAAMSGTTRIYARIDEQPEQVQLQLVSGEWFRLLGVPAALGRVLADGDATASGANPVAVLSHGFWTRRFGGDSAIVGRVVTLNRTSFTVIGVAAPSFQGLTVGQSLDVWTPVTMQHELGYRTSAASSSSAHTEQPWIPQDGMSWLTTLVRVPAGSYTAVATRLATLFRSELPDELADRDSAARAQGLNERVVLEPRPRGFSPLRDAFREPLRILLGAVALLLAIACANIAGLLMARGSARRHEVAMRISLGARRGRLVRQLLTESLLLAMFGGVLGMILAQWGATAIVRAVYNGASTFPLDVTLNGGVLTMAALTTIVTGVLFGLAPALQASRAAVYHGSRGISTRSEASDHRLPLGRLLVASQIALSLLLVTTAGLALRSLVNMTGINTGYDATVVTARVDLRAGGYPVDQLAGLYERLTQEIGAVPGVRSVSLSTAGLATGFRRISGFTVPGRSLTPPHNAAQENFVSPAFFSTVGMRLLRGRDFSESDRDGAARVAIVSESAARQFFGTTDAVGARFGFGTPPELEVIGVVADARVNNVLEVPRLVFYPLAQAPRDYIYSIEARIDGAPTGITSAIRAAIGRVDAAIPVGAVRTLRETLDAQLWRERLLARLAGAFGLIALLIAAIGLYGVVAYSATRRTNEMGVRLALGATPGGVQRLVLGDSLLTVLGGIALGVALSIPALGVTKSLLYDVRPHDPAALAIASLLLLTIGVLAAAIPAWRASRIDPLTAIRAE